MLYYKIFDIILTYKLILFALWNIKEILQTPYGRFPDFSNMSSISSTAQKKLTLIETPKTRKEWENNKAYYQQKFFTTHQKKELRENKNKLEQAMKVIGKRQEFGLCGIMHFRSGNDSESAKKRAWQYKMESMHIEYERYYKQPATTTPLKVDILEAEVDTHPDNSFTPDCSCPTDTSYFDLNNRTDEIVDSWEELC